MTSLRTERCWLGLLSGLAIACGDAQFDEQTSSTGESIIAGTDQRTDVFSLGGPNPVTRNADGVAIMTFTGALSPQGGAVALPVASLQNAQNACSSVRFANQPVLTAGFFCSSYLVAPRLVATAGHCTGFAPTGTDASQYSFVFGYEMIDAASARSAVPAADVYRGLRVHGTCGGGDCTLIELDRPVTNHVILGLRSDGAPSVGDDVYVLGHPLGLPLKFDGPNALFRVIPEVDLFAADTIDIAGGNSGSPVFNAATNLVEGTLTSRSDIGGISDLEPTPEGCNVEHVAQPEEGMFETGFLVSAFEPSVPAACSGDANGWAACSTNGCGVCSQKLDTTAFDLYLQNHPNCVVDAACSGAFTACSEACPAPTPADNGRTVPPPPGDALLVIGPSTIGLADGVVRDSAIALGIPVVVKTASATSAADASGKSVVLISSTVSPANIGAKFRDVPVGVVVWEAAVFDDMGMTGNRSSVDLGTISSQTSLNVVAPGHPLAAGLSGLIAVTSNSNMLSWGRPSGNSVIATLAGSPAKSAIFAYEAGQPMAGLVAPGRRVGFFLHDTTAAKLSGNGGALLRAAIAWAAGH